MGCSTRAIAACAALSLCTCASALGRVVSYAEIQGHLFGSIQHLETCGHWRAGERFGEFRIIRVYYAGQDMLFVDMIAVESDGVYLGVEHGFTFPEVNNDHAQVGLERVTCTVQGENGIGIEAEAVNGHNDRPYRFTLTIDGVKRTYDYNESE